MNRFLTNKKDKFVAKNKLEVDSLEMFPELKANVPQTNNASSSNTFNFKNVLNTKAVETEKKELDIILPGWAKLSRKQTRQMRLKSAIKEEQLENLNETMDQIIFKMEHRWNQYEYLYDQIHGEGAYADKFVLPPVYGVDYETDVESETAESDFIMSDDDDNIYNDYDNTFDNK